MYLPNRSRVQLKNSSSSLKRRFFVKLWYKIDWKRMLHLLTAQGEVKSLDFKGLKLLTASLFKAVEYLDENWCIVAFFEQCWPTTLLTCHLQNSFHRFEPVCVRKPPRRCAGPQKSRRRCAPSGTPCQQLSEQKEWGEGHCPCPWDKDLCNMLANKL